MLKGPGENTDGCINYENVMNSLTKDEMIILLNYYCA